MAVTSGAGGSGGGRMFAPRSDLHVRAMMPKQLQSFSALKVSTIKGPDQSHTSRPNQLLEYRAGAGKKKEMAELTSTKLNAESHLLLVRIHLPGSLL
jgi:hypothetical protein